MPRLRTEQFGAGDQRWLGSAHGIWECQTVTLDISAFTENTYWPDGYILSGTPLARIASGLAVPYVSGGGTGTGVLWGFLFTDQSVIGTGDIPAPMLDHGRVKTEFLPVGFTVPTAANNRTTVVFLAGAGS